MPLVLDNRIRRSNKQFIITKHLQKDFSTELMLGLARDRGIMKYHETANCTVCWATDIQT